MEGDVLFAALPLGWMLAFGAAMVMGIGGLMRWFARYMLGELEKRLARIETVSEEVRRIEGELKRLMMELPMQYQRRDDAIREYVAINAKLDRLYELMMEQKMTDKHLGAVIDNARAEREFLRWVILSALWHARPYGALENVILGACRDIPLRVTTDQVRAELRSLQKRGLLELQSDGPSGAPSSAPPAKPWWTTAPTAPQTLRARRGGKHGTQIRCQALGTRCARMARSGHRAGSLHAGRTSGRAAVALWRAAIEILSAPLRARDCRARAGGHGAGGGHRARGARDRGRQP